ncbi:hypothetical protein Q5530_24370 [Saccharothrix sp. BKS2]|uniref:Uncharacterized protein n=1 Tax=Saccharothrix lopnurensis TaxID=1670621 RepID=A0ABW1PCC2_9PSEU
MAKKKKSGGTLGLVVALVVAMFILVPSFRVVVLDLLEPVLGELREVNPFGS